MKNKNGLIALALVGLAAGAAAYYLLGTDDGKEKLKGAKCHIKDLTKSLKQLTKRQKKKAEKLAKTAQSDLEKLGKKIKETGKQAVEKAADKTISVINKVEKQ